MLIHGLEQATLGEMARPWDSEQAVDESLRALQQLPSQPMFIYAGIDEAGYGPMLGPLCVASSVFLLEDPPEDGHAPDLWSSLQRALSKTLKEARGRITITDSKKLKGAHSGRSHPLRHLERGVLACLGAGESNSSMLENLTEEDLFERLGVTVPEHPWYQTAGPLPTACDTGRLRIDASLLRRAMQSTGIQCAALRCEAMGAADFNRSIDETRNKSGVNMQLVIRQIEAIWARFPDARPRVVVDRQGGRTAYREDLQVAWPESSIKVMLESPEMSRYELTMPGRGELIVIFTMESELHHLPVALASMTAKYVRELMMGRMNSYFQGRRPGIQATAGYVEDARRYLADIEPVLAEDRIDRAKLVRCC